MRPAAEEQSLVPTRIIVTDSEADQGIAFEIDHDESSRHVLYQPDDFRLVRPPASNEVFLRLVEAIHLNHGEEAWFSLLLPRFGFSHVVDTSSKALVTASHFRHGQYGVTLRSTHERFGKALRTTQEYLSQLHGTDCVDQTLAAVALLAIHDGVVGQQNLVVWLHVQAFEAVLANRFLDASPGTLTWGILDYHCCDISNYACVRSIASPLESIFRAPHGNWSICPGTEAQFLLKSLSRILTITIPRLAALTREAAASSQSSLERALILCADLYPLVDNEAEIQILNGTAGKPVREPFSNKPRTMLWYQSFLSYDCTVRYWQARGALLRICNRLSKLQSFARGDVASVTLPTSETMHYELRRISHRLMMSSDYALSLRNGSRKRLFAQGMVTLWGILNDFDDVVEDLKAVRAEILMTTNAALSLKVPLSRRDLDDAEQIFVGGPIQGAYARVYGLGSHCFKHND